MVNVKGGVWTNIEDEILKAAISKYGLNQWARVSSLLARKTPKQCKARWSEWLDPQIRKIEWSKEEDEKLLHLAKLMPTQWRTIAPIVGRTATQCLERYQKLLDENEQRDSGELGLGGPGGEAAAPSADDVRKLRAGELDPDPESKPARPDTVDLDEDEKEMLSEARARLANTQGKKAKRKARERQLEQSRRVAALQKRRELKMSGINIKIKTAKKGEMDYNADIPFEHAPAKGYYNTEEEEKRNLAQLAAFDPRKQQVANKRKGEDQDGAEDRKRQKNDKGQQGQSVSAAAMKAAQQQKIREAEQSSKRRALVLPAPQLKETEMDQVVKEQRAAQQAIQLAGLGENEATRGLVGNYNTNLLGATPMRTPRAAPEEDRVANEVRNLRAMTNTQSALLGGDGPELVGGSGTTGFEGATPRPHVVATPNPMATPFRQVNGTGATPMRNGPGATPMMTPRDALNLNRVNSMQLVGQTPRDIRLHEKATRQALIDKLAALPKPKAVDYEINLPEEEQESTTVALSEEDAAIRDAREKKLRDANELIEFKRQTQVAQRRLPRPAVVDADAMLKNAHAIDDPARRAVAIESALLVANDAHKFGGTKIKGSFKPLQAFDDSLLEKARYMVKGAVEGVPDFTDAWNQIHDSTKLPGLDGYYEDEIDEHQMMVEVFDNLEDKITETAEKGQELEKKLAKLHGGYQQRSRTLQQKILATAEKLERTRIDVNTSLNAQVGEEAAASRRLEALRDEVAFISRREREAQEEYRRTQQELSDLPAPVNGVH
ncbi:hypothetical protein EG328_005483 [Venturia inaequalis]|nr:hypothetical protein EG328_005483 [Venturia inaequalis]